jgi:hypothetical protein
VQLQSGKQQGVEVGARSTGSIHSKQAVNLGVLLLSC